MMQVLGVFLVVATICIFAVGKWSENQIKEKNDQLFGRWNEVFLNVDEEDVEYFRRHAFIDDYSVQNIQEKIYLEGDDRIIIGTCDDNFFELGNLEMVDGRKPVYEGEVAIEEEYLDVLGVEKVGDIISEGVNIDSLEGYKVCGIVKDYSSRWKMVNWDVKYINCFISDAKANEIQIYAALSPAVQQDIETNMLEYRENISQNKNWTIENIMEIIFGIGLLEFCLYVDLRWRLKRYTVVNLFEKVRFARIIKIKMREPLVCFLKFSISMLIIVLVNKTMVGIHDSYRVLGNLYNMDMDITKEVYLKENGNMGYDVFRSNDIKEESVDLFVITNRGIVTIIEGITIVFWIVLLNYIFITQQKVGYENKMQNSKFIFIHHYYYAKGGDNIRNTMIKCVGSEMIIAFLYMYFMIGLLTYDISISDEFIMINMIVSYIIYVIYLMMRSLLTLNMIKRMVNNSDWIITTDAE